MPSDKSREARVAAVLTRAPGPAKFVYVSDATAKIYCRPDCDIGSGLDPAQLVFYDSSADAAKKGFKPCNYCKPDLEVKVDNEVIESTVSVVNASLGLDLPSTAAPAQQLPAPTANLDRHSISGFTTDDLGSVNDISTFHPSLYNHHHWRSISSVGNSGDFIDVQDPNWRPRRVSIASGHIPAALAAVNVMSQKTATVPRAQSTKRDRTDGERDHARLVDEACRHIAAAAAASAAAAAAAASSDDDVIQTKTKSRKARDAQAQSLRSQRKKRRGGILGFKELAAKAGLSPWHFHRVFRSVTGLTPKAYGEACWSAVTSTPGLPSSIAATAASASGSASLSNGPTPSPGHIASSAASPQMNDMHQSFTDMRSNGSAHNGLHNSMAQVSLDHTDSLLPLNTPVTSASQMMSLPLTADMLPPASSGMNSGLIPALAGPVVTMGTNVPVSTSSLGPVDGDGAFSLLGAGAMFAGASTPTPGIPVTTGMPTSADVSLDPRGGSATLPSSGMATTPGWETMAQFGFQDGTPRLPFQDAMTSAPFEPVTTTAGLSLDGGPIALSSPGFSDLAAHDLFSGTSGTPSSNMTMMMSNPMMAMHSGPLDHLSFDTQDAHDMHWIMASGDESNAVLAGDDKDTFIVY